MEPCSPKRCGLYTLLELVTYLAPVGDAFEQSQLIGCELAHDRLHQLAHGISHQTGDRVGIMEGEAQRNVLHLVTVAGRVSHHYHEFLFVMRLPVGHRVVLAEVTHYRNFVLGFLLA